MKESAAGFDGWTKSSLKLLPKKPLRIWADIESLAKGIGKVPEAYLHVPLAIIPKGHAVKLEQFPGVSIFSMLHRMVYGVMWHKLMT